MTLPEFYKWATVPQRAIANYRGTYPGECVSLVSMYLNLCYGLEPGAWGDASAYWTNTNPAILAKFDKVSSNQFQDGDIGVWGGGAGHVAIRYNGKWLNQNNLKRHYVTLDDNIVMPYLGLLRPKKGDIMDRETVNYAYLLATGEPANEVRLKMWTGQPAANLLKSLYNMDNVDIRDRLASIPGKDKQIDDLSKSLDDSNIKIADLTKLVANNTNQINDLKAQINVINAAYSADVDTLKLDKVTLMAKIDTETVARQKAEQDAVDANNALKTAQKALQDELAKPPVVCPICPEPVETDKSVNVVTRFIQSIMKLLNKKGK